MQPHRKTIRLQDFDYATPGAYFVTICLQDRKCLFGEIVEDKVVLTASGKMVERSPIELPQFVTQVKLDEFVVMPNHVHAIIWIDPVGAGLCARPELSTGEIDPVGAGLRARPESPTNNRVTSLFNIMERFKSLTTKRYIDGVHFDHWPPFDKHLWQRSYYEHVVRSDDELTRARSYIQTNPLRWELDKENPDRKSVSGT